MADDGLTLAQLVRDKYPGAYDDLSDHQLEAMVQQRYPGAYNDILKTPHETAKAEDYYKPDVRQQGLGASLMEGARGVGDSVVGVVKNIGHMLSQNPLTTGKELVDAQVNQFTKAKNAPTVSEKIGHAAAGIIPVVGPMIANAAEDIGSLDPRRMGKGAADVAPLLAASPSVRAGATRAGQATARTIAPVVQKVPAKVRAVATNPLVDTAIGAYEGYHFGGIPGMIGGAYGGSKLSKLLKAAEKFADSKASGTTAKTAKKADSPRLVKPGLEKDLETELSGRIDSVAPSRPVEGPMPSLADVMNQRLRDAAESPARAGATTEFTRPNPNAGGRLAGQSVPVKEAVRELRREAQSPKTPTPAPHLKGHGERNAAAGGYSARTSSQSREMLDPKPAEAPKPAETPKPKPAAETPKPAETPAAPATEPVTIGRSKSKSRPTYTENDLKAAKEKWGSTDIAELREKYGAAVDEYLLAQRALRHQQHYGNARDAAATRKGQQGILPEVRQMFEAALRERSGK
jgi:hypothetical protein